MNAHFSRLLLLGLLTLLSHGLCAQTLNWGPQQRYARNTTINEIIGQDDRGYYVHLSRNGLFSASTPMVAHYRHDHTLRYQSPLRPLANRNVMVSHFWHYNDHLHVYFTSYQRNTGDQVLYSHAINKSTGRLTGKPVALTRARTFNRSDMGTLLFAAAMDSSHAVILHRSSVINGLFQRPQLATFQLQVLDSAQAPLWDRLVQTPFNDNLIDIERVSVDAQGTAYVLARIYEQRRVERRRGEANYFYKLMVYRRDQKDPTTYDLALDDLFITDITFKVNRSGRIVCSGFYSERRTYSMKGAFYFTINPVTQAIEGQGQQPFDTDFLAQLMSRRSARKGRELRRFYLDDLILRSDGGAVLIAEEYFVTTNTYYTGTGVNRVANTTYTYHYDDIIVVNLNPDATIAWAASIPKDQSGSSRAFSSYALGIGRGAIHFVFNERISRRAPVMLASVDTQGSVSLKELFSNRNEGILTRPQLCRQVTRNELILFGEGNRRRYKFGRLTLD